MNDPEQQRKRKMERNVKKEESTTPRPNKDQGAGKRM